MTKTDSALSKVKIIANSDGAIEISIDGKVLKQVTDISFDLNLDRPASVTFGLLADVEIETEAVVYANIDGDKYKIQKV